MANVEQVKVRFARIVRERLRQMKLNQTELALRVGVTHGTVSAWLNLNRRADGSLKSEILPSRDNVYALADALHISSADLFNALGQAVVLPPGIRRPSVSELSNLANALPEEDVDALIAQAQFYTRRISSAPTQSDTSRPSPGASQQQPTDDGAA